MNRIFLALILIPVFVSALPPVLYFSDLTDGAITGWENSAAKGAAVSIWGRNFGTSRGTSTVTVCGVTLNQATDFAEWGSTDNPRVPLGMQRITFWLRSGMQTGQGTIKVTTGEGTSDEIPFYCRATGNIYFIDPVNGDDSFTGKLAARSGSDGPKRSPAWARKNLVAGDVVYLRGGVYDIEDKGTGYNGGIFTFGRSNGVPNHNNGARYNSISVAAYPGELVDMRASTYDYTKFTGAFGIRSGIYHCYPGSMLTYWTFSKLKINASWAAFSIGGGSNGGVYPYGGTRNIRIIGSEGRTIWTPHINNYTQFGNIIMAQGSTYGMDGLYIYGNYLHDQLDSKGWDAEPGVPIGDQKRAYYVYVGGYGQLENLDFGWNDMAYGYRGRGVQIYGHLRTDHINNLYFHNNWIHDVNRQLLVFGGDHSPAYQFLSNVYIYNNIFSNPGGDTSWPTVVLGGTLSMGRYAGNYYVYNNIFYKRVNIGSPMQVASYLKSLDLKNNIIVDQFQTGTNNLYYSYYPDSESAFLTNVEADAGNNLYYTFGGSKVLPIWDNSSINGVIPGFGGISQDDKDLDYFRLVFSRAFDSGSSDSTLLVKRDFWGVPRPQGSGVDIGVQEDPGACSEGDKRPCPLDAGVCEGAMQICSKGLWGICDYGPESQIAEKRCRDGLDNDCDGKIDVGDPDCDLTAPVVLGVTYWANATTARINWTTDEFANESLEYGTTASFGSRAVYKAFLKTHTVPYGGQAGQTPTPLTNLIPDTVYYYRITSCDDVGNCGVSATYQFRTKCVVGCSSSCGNSVCDSGEDCMICPSDCHSLNSADTNPCDGCISDTELLAEIAGWKSGSATMPSLLSAISAWKAGC